MIKNRLLLILFSLVFILPFFTTSCAKEELDDDSSQEIPDEEIDTTDTDYLDEEDYDGGESPIRDDTLSVAEFISCDFEGGVFVEGYIVGACTMSYKYAEFEPPFSHPQALLIADSPNERSKSNIVAVELKRKGVKADLNLVDNPKNYHRKIILYGYWSVYLHMNGMRDVGSYKVE